MKNHKEQKALPHVDGTWDCAIDDVTGRPHILSVYTNGKLHLFLNVGEGQTNANNVY